jgi:hypothetical protein
MTAIPSGIRAISRSRRAANSALSNAAWAETRSGGSAAIRQSTSCVRRTAAAVTQGMRWTPMG